MALINHIAHEINNPLQALVNCLAILKVRPDPQYVEMAEAQSKRVAQVVLDLLTLTRSKKPADPAT